MRLMSCIGDLKQKFREYENAMRTCLPQVDKKLITELLLLMKKDEAPMYTLEIFLKKNANIQEIRERVAKQTGQVATFYDQGTHMVAAHRITLEMLEEICRHDDVVEIKGTHIIRGAASIGPSHERTSHDEIWNDPDSLDDLDWDDIKGKEARGVDDADLGEVQELRGNIVVTKAGVIDKKVYHIPKSLVERYDGHKLWFDVSKDEAKSKYEVED
jgi:hypothetical protein